MKLSDLRCFRLRVFVYFGTLVEFSSLTLSSTGPRKRFREMTSSHVGGHGQGFPLSPIRNHGKQARANELIAKGDGYTFTATPRSPDLRHTEKRQRHLCYCVCVPFIINQTPAAGGPLSRHTHTCGMYVGMCWVRGESTQVYREGGTVSSKGKKCSVCGDDGASSQGAGYVRGCSGALLYEVWVVICG